MGDRQPWQDQCEPSARVWECVTQSTCKGQGLIGAALIFGNKNYQHVHIYNLNLYPLMLNVYKLNPTLKLNCRYYSPSSKRGGLLPTYLSIYNFFAWYMCNFKEIIMVIWYANKIFSRLTYESVFVFECQWSQSPLTYRKSWHHFNKICQVGDNVAPTKIVN